MLVRGETIMHRREFLSASALLLAGAARAAERAPLKVLTFGMTLGPVLADLEKDYRVKVLVADAVKGSKTGEVKGLEQLADADVWVGAVTKRTFPSDEQLAHVKKFLADGKPFVGLRAAHHSLTPKGWRIDREVFGVDYGGHHLLNKDPVLKIEMAKGAGDHPILKGLTPPAPRSGSYHHKVIADDVKVLLYAGLPGDMQPHTWTRENAKTKGRAFYTRYDRKQIEKDETCRAIFVRGLLWALNRRA